MIKRSKQVQAVAVSFKRLFCAVCKKTVSVSPPSPARYYYHECKVCMSRIDPKTAKEVKSRLLAAGKTDC
jgi:uncharacterized CHY-type Zn-finger protein